MTPIKKLPSVQSSARTARPVYGSARSEGDSPQVQRTRARLLDAAVRVFGQLGRAASINDIVQAAGISRPSFYNYYPGVDALFESVSAELLSDMNLRVDRSFDAIADPAARISIGIRHFCKRAHEDADWANFLLNFALVDPAITDHARSTLLRDIAAGARSGRFALREDQVPAAFSMIVGGTLTAMMVVRRGIDGYVPVGRQTAAASLRMLGLGAAEADELAQIPLTDLRG
jgi:AcrR family transcriptional regulator